MIDGFAGHHIQCARYSSQSTCTTWWQTHALSLCNSMYMMVAGLRLQLLAMHEYQAPSRTSDPIAKRPTPYCEFINSDAQTSYLYRPRRIADGVQDALTKHQRDACRYQQPSRGLARKAPELIAPLA